MNGHAIALVAFALAIVAIVMGRPNEFFWFILLMGCAVVIETQEDAG